MSVETWTWIVVGITFLFYLYIGWRARVRTTAGFYVAGQGVPAVANGAATAADWMSAASFIGMAGAISALGSDGSVYLMGWTGGYVLLALLLAPYLRKFGKFTVPDFVGDRYYSSTARVVASIAAIFVSVTYVVGQMQGVGIVFTRFLGFTERWHGILVGMGIVSFFAVLGGMKGITWTQVAQYVVLIVAFLIPAVAISRMLTGNPVPQAAFTFSEIADNLNGIYRELGLGEYTKAFTEIDKLNVFCITTALMVGTAGLPHVIVRFYTVPTVRAARISAAWALFFIAILYTTAPAMAVFARYNLIQSLHGKTSEDIDRLDWARKWEKSGLIAFDDKNGDGRYQMAAAGANEIRVHNDVIVLSTPEVANLAPWIIALVAAGGLAAALSTASGLLLVISSSVAHDLYYRLINPAAEEGKRLLVGRIMIFAAVLVAGFFAIIEIGFVAQVVAFAFGLAAASFFPVIILGIFDKRTNKEGAIFGMVVGLGFTLFYIIWTQFAGQKPFCFGIGAQGIGTVGMLLNLVVTFVVSRFTPPPPIEVQELVERVRLPRGAGEAAEH